DSRSAERLETARRDARRAAPRLRAAADAVNLRAARLSTAQPHEVRTRPEPPVRSPARQLTRPRSLPRRATRAAQIPQPQPQAPERSSTRSARESRTAADSRSTAATASAR